MNHHHVKYLLAGAGAAASSAAVAIRQRDAAGSLLMVGQEINRPYQRSPLSKRYLRRETTHEALFTLDAAWFDQHQVQLRTGRRVERLDTARRAVTLDNGEEVSYDRLLLATGALPRRLDVIGADLPNLFYLRNLADADRLSHAIDQARAAGQSGVPGHLDGPELPAKRGKVVVIGGGVLGVELASTLAMLGFTVDLLCGSSHPWSRFAGPTAGQAVARYLARHGVNVLIGRRAARLEGDGRVQRVIADDGQSLGCDFAIAAIGTTINRNLLRGTPIAAETAVLVDEGCQSSEAQIWAAGDCAAVLDVRFGKHRVVDHANHAAATGTIAGINMAGGQARYGDLAPGDAFASPADGWTTSLFNLTASVFGEPRLVYRWILRGSAAGEDPRFAEIGVAADGRVAEVLCFGDCPQREGLIGLVDRRVDVNGLEETLKDPAAALPV